jgi:hypothetical protein
VKSVKEVQARLVEEHLGHPVPFKAFLQPCEPVV